MTAAADFDPAALHTFLDDRLGPAPLNTLERISGGQSNPTWFVTHGAKRMVLRKQPRGPTLRGAHAVDREFRALECLHPTGVPVLRPILFHADPALLGTPFYLMERVEGRVFDDAALPSLPADQRRPIWMAMADAMAAMHRVRPDAVGLGDFGRPGNYFERQLSRWTRQLQDRTAPRSGNWTSWRRGWPITYRPMTGPWH